VQGFAREVVAVILPFQPTAGQIALIEPVALGLGDRGSDCRHAITGVVQSAGTEVLTIMGLSSHDLVDHAAVVVSIFAPEALYRIDALAHWGESGRLLIEPIRDVERIQRRRWPRHAVHVNVTLASLDEGDDSIGGVAGRTIDLGMGGLRVETIRRLTPGADLTVMFTLPDGARVVARTTVISAAVSDDGCEYGLAFNELEDADATHLMALVGARSMG
jgi:PilZ domain